MKAWFVVLLFSSVVLNCNALNTLEQDGCAVCRPSKELVSKETPRLYHRPHGGGIGSLVYSMIHAAAYANSRGWIYGGPVDLEKNELSIVNFVFNAGSAFTTTSAQLKTIPSVLKITKASELGEVKGPPWPSSDISIGMDDWIHYEKQCPTEDFPRFRYSDQVPVLDSIFKPDFIKLLQTSNQPALKHVHMLFNSTEREAPHVAIHIRTGKLVKGSPHTRKHTLDSYYYAIIEIIRTKYPKAEIHGFPNLGKKENAPLQSETQFEGYLKRNITLHYNTPILETWAHMIKADILVMAHSVFSSVPALLNKNCVVYDHFWLGKLERHATIHSFKQKFDQCYEPPKKKTKKLSAGKYKQQPLKFKQGTI